MPIRFIQNWFSESLFSSCQFPFIKNITESLFISILSESSKMGGWVARMQFVLGSSCASSSLHQVLLLVLRINEPTGKDFPPLVNFIIKSTKML